MMNKVRYNGSQFVIANGTIDHLRWNTFDAIIAPGFWPDITSTYGFAPNRSVPGVVDLPNILSKLLNFSDMSLSEVVATAMVNAAKVFPFLRDKGTLNVGADADVVVLELREGSLSFLIIMRGVRVGKLRLFPVETLYGGAITVRI